MNRIVKNLYWAICGSKITVDYLFITSEGKLMRSKVNTNRNNSNLLQDQINDIARKGEQFPNQ